MPPPPPPHSLAPIHVLVDEAPRTAPTPPTNNNPPLRNQPEFFMTGVRPLPAQPDSECTTCLEPLTDDVVQIARCGHVFHCTCILAWFQSSYGQRNRCPNCRAELYTYAQVARVGEQPLVPGEFQLEAQRLQRRVEEARRRRDEMLQREDDERVTRRQRIDAMLRQIDERGLPEQQGLQQAEDRLRQSSFYMPDEMGQRRELNRQNLRRQFLEERDRLQENVEQQLDLPRQQDTIPANPPSAIGDIAPSWIEQVLRNTFDLQNMEDIERILQHTDVPTNVRRYFEVELDLRRTEDRNNNASTVAGAGGNSFTRAHLMPPAPSDRPRRSPPHRLLADSGYGFRDPIYQQRHVSQPYHPDVLAAQRAQTSSRRSLRSQAGQVPHPRAENVTPSGSSRFLTITPASGPLPRPGSVQGTNLPGTTISPQEDSPGFTRASSPVANTATRLSESPQRPNVRFDPDTEPPTASHWRDNFPSSPRATAPSRSNRPADLDIPMTRRPSLSPSPPPFVDFASTDLRERVISTQRQTTTLEIPRPNQEMRDFMRRTDPSPTLSASYGLQSTSMVSTMHSRTSSMEAIHPRAFSRRTAKSRTTDGGGGSASSAAASQELRVPFLRAARNRRLPFPAVMHWVQRQHVSQSPAQDVEMRDAEAGVGAEADSSDDDLFVMPRRPRDRGWGPSRSP